MIEKILKRFTGWFLKDTRVVITPGSHAEAKYDISSLTVDPLETKKATITRGSASFEVTGTSGQISPWDIPEPFDYFVWEILEQQFGIKDVQLELSSAAPDLDTMMIMANNPTVGRPYVIMVDCSRFKVSILPMSEGDRITWQDASGARNFTIIRHDDTSNKEFEIIVDP